MDVMFSCAPSTAKRVSRPDNRNKEKRRFHAHPALVGANTVCGDVPNTLNKLCPVVVFATDCAALARAVNPAPCSACTSSAMAVAFWAEALAESVRSAPTRVRVVKSIVDGSRCMLLE